MLQSVNLIRVLTFHILFSTNEAIQQIMYPKKKSVEINPIPLRNNPIKNITITDPNGSKAEYCGPAKMIKYKFSTEWQNCEKGTQNLANGMHPLEGQRTAQILQSLGYSRETHYVKTEDGYILTVYRMTGPRKNNNKKRGPPVYVNHGMTATSDFWFFQTKEKTLPVKLYESGFDVWLSNCRGTSYSLGHEALDYNNDLEYWNFSFHEMGVYDMPAVTDHIISSTGYKKILYIGYSMGTTQAFIGLAELPELNKKIEAAFMLAPTAYLGHATSSTRVLARVLHSYETYQLINKQVKGRFSSSSQMRDTFGLYTADYCAHSTARCGMCDNVWFAMFGYNSPQMNRTEMPNILKRIPDITSAKTFSHYGQSMHSCKFQHYNYGPVINMEKYGSAAPPDYKLENIKTDMYFYYSNNDNLCVPHDVKITAHQLQSGVLKGMYKVPDKWFTHLDFAIAKDADALVFNKIVSDMKAYK